MSADDRKPELNPEIEVLSREIQSIDEKLFPKLKLIGENELFRLRGGIADTLDLVENKRVKIRAKVKIPSEQYPYVNFVGKLLGPGGQTVRTIQDETKTKMAILGSGSLRDESKEKDLLASGDPKYQHLKHILHLQIDCLAPPAEAYYNISHALAQVRRVMLPDTTGAPAPPWAAGQPVGNKTPNVRGRGAPRGRGRGGPDNQASYAAAINFNNPAPTAPPMRGRGVGGRGRGWNPSMPPVNGAQPPMTQPTLSAPTTDYYGNSMEQFSYPPYNQPEYETTGYEEFPGTYGQHDPWGKMGISDSRGRGRVHPYTRPAGGEDTA